MKQSSFIWLPALCLAVSACSTGQSSKAPESTVHNVFLVDPVPVDGSSIRKFPGIVQETRTISTGFKTPGQITRIFVKEGDHVKEGQLLATLDTVDYALAVKQLQIQYDHAASEHERKKQLYAAGNMSDNEFEKAAAALRQMAVQLEINKNKLEYTHLYAPSSGVIVKSSFEKAEMVDAGTPVFELMDDSRLEVVVDLPVSEYVNHGKSHTYTGSSTLLGDAPINLSFISLTPKADNNQLYQLKLGVTSRDSRLSSGMNIIVSISSDGNNAVSDSVTTISAMEIPLRSVFEHDGKTCVWTFNPADSTVKATPVTVTGNGTEGIVTATSGLSHGVRIGSGGVHSRFECEHVKVIEKNSTSNRGGLL